MKHRVYSCVINYCIIIHTNSCKPTFAPPCIYLLAYFAKRNYKKDETNTNKNDYLGWEMKARPFWVPFYITLTFKPLTFYAYWKNKIKTKRGKKQTVKSEIMINELNLLNYFSFFLLLFFLFVFLFANLREKERKREREARIGCSTHLCTHWLLPVYALTGHRTSNFGASGWCCNQLNYLVWASSDFWT